MSWFHRFSNLFRRDKVDEELAEELQFHLEARTRDNRNAGKNAEEAEHDARRRFGNATLAKERAHEINIVMSIETIGRDLRYALRSLRRSLGFTLVAILTLALGFGVNTAVFTVVNGVLLRPLPFPDPGRLLLISYQSKLGMFENRSGLYDKDYLEYERHNQFRPAESAGSHRLAALRGRACGLPAGATGLSSRSNGRVALRIGPSAWKSSQTSKTTADVSTSPLDLRST